ncbi:MATE family efflux protein [Pseudomonas syringae pv. berberidis]|nr:MATE family efflux protein [Pseudomonas syringae pv. berberidis]RMP69426.1 MATE family efflux protein [Pseudomonas syringae pv. berberidis]RMQ42160.1 MATE family efflux protein [Pseudomonas syringae pv. berberidis]
MAAMAPFCSQELAAMGVIGSVIQVALCVEFALSGALIRRLVQNLCAHCSLFASHNDNVGVVDRLRRSHLDVTDSAG